jgi:hypothetical protein
MLLLLLLAVPIVSAGCTTLASKADTGVVIARRAQVRSSIAVVAADLSEVVRGDVVDILDSTTAENGERWLRVRAHDAENTEGWIEARNVMPQDLLGPFRSGRRRRQGHPGTGHRTTQGKHKSAFVCGSQRRG